MDLTRLLRLRRLIGLGLPLRRINEALRTDPAFLDTELEVLEADVLEQIDILNQQLAAIRSARASASPDSVAVYDGGHDALRDLWTLPGVRQIERDVGLLLASTGDEHLLERMRSGFEDSARLIEMSRLSRRFRSIDDDSPPAERAALVAELDRVLSPWADLGIPPQLSQLVDSYLKQAFTPSQLDILAEVRARTARRNLAPRA